MPSLGVELYNFRFGVPPASIDDVDIEKRRNGAGTPVVKRVPGGPLSTTRTSQPSRNLSLSIVFPYCDAHARKYICIYVVGRKITQKRHQRSRTIVKKLTKTVPKYLINKNKEQKLLHA